VFVDDALRSVEGRGGIPKSWQQGSVSDSTQECLRRITGRADRHRRRGQQ
jgi:hypothetical protein